MNESSAFLRHWEHLIALAAFIVSVGAITLSLRAEQASIAANVVTLGTGGRLLNTTDCEANKCKSERDLFGIIDLQNAGRADIQITSAEVEVFLRDEAVSKEIRAYITEDFGRIPPNSWKPPKELVFELGDPTIFARSQKRLFIRATSNDPSINIVGSRLKLEFSNGQRMTVIPKITDRISGGSSD